MSSSNRERLLKFVVIAAVALLALDRLILTSAFASWKEQGERIEALRDKVTRGRQLTARERSIRGRWAKMQQTDLPEDVSVAENEVFKAIGRWTRESRVSFTSLTPQWRQHEEAGYDTFEFRATANGDQASLGRLLHELETDPLPARIDECEIATRDKQGKQLALTLRFSFLRLAEEGGAR
jgi:hypothetical protein